MIAILKYRKAQNLTQRQLGDKVGLTQSAINQYETGVRKPDIITLKKIANVLGCTVDDLLEPIKV